MLAVVEFGGPVGVVMAENPTVVTFVLDFAAGKNTEKIQLQQMYH